jgi:hypothetical protein
MVLRFALSVVEPFKAAELLGLSLCDPERRGVRLDRALDLDRPRMPHFHFDGHDIIQGQERARVRRVNPHAAG